MAADILLYNADLVPVGKDQTQHIELTRDIAQRFNNIYSPTFTIPEGYIPESGAKVMDLQEPTKKMSKSSGNPNSFILIMDPPEVIRRKINRCVTDSIGKVKYSDDQPGIKNLINILIALQGTTAEEVEKKYENLGYAEFKNDVAEAIVQELKPIQDKVKHYLENKYYLEEIYKKRCRKGTLCIK